MDIDHQFNSSGQDADNGAHKKCSFLEQANLGTGAVGKTILGSQTVAGKGELVYTDEDDNDVQITDAGDLNITATTLGKIYPIGSVYINATNATNPATLLGFGTWTAFGAGRVMVGLDSGDTDFDTAEETGGVKEVTLTADQSGLPSHEHLGTSLGGSGSETSYSVVSGRGTTPDSTTTSAANPDATNVAGGSSAVDAHTNLQPYITVYMWKRSA